MTPEEQRVAIAELRGWTEVTEAGDGLFGRENGASNWGKPIPDFINDLNAWPEIERAMTPAETDEFEELLGYQLSPRTNSARPRFWHASAAQKAKAFLRLCGKWME